MADDLGLRATVVFNSREDADEFAIRYSRRTMKGYTVGAVDCKGRCSVMVDVDGYEEKAWLDDYVRNKNKQNSI